MTHLTQQTCVPCRGGVPPLTAGELALLLPEVPDWTLGEQDSVQRIQRDFRFKDFRGAMEFAVRVGELAEREQHHPELHVGWGHVTVELWTHKIRGLHQNDFIMAAKIDEILAASNTRA
jgi:4a-hydroxytetrahydrobiopterin dehydratase